MQPHSGYPVDPRRIRTTGNEGYADSSSGQVVDLARKVFKDTFLGDEIVSSSVGPALSDPNPWELGQKGSARTIPKKNPLTNYIQTAKTS